jgi:hypothetical protein
MHSYCESVFIGAVHAIDIVLIPMEQAASLLNRTTVMLNRLARQGALQRRWADRWTGEPIPDSDVDVSSRHQRSNLRGMFSRGEVERLVLKRESKRSLFSPNDPERSSRRPMYRSMEVFPNELDRLTPAGAAHFQCQPEVQFAAALVL